MTTRLQAGANDASTVRLALDSTPTPTAAGRESVRLLAIGTPRGVQALIHRLHQLGFAEVGAWSRPMPAPHPGEVMSILTWAIWVE